MPENSEQSAGATAEGGLSRRGFIAGAGAATAAALAVGAQGAAAEEGSSPMLQVAMLSGWHAHAAGYGRTLRQMPDTEVTVVWDEEPERGQAWAEELEADWEPDYHAVLRRDDVQAVAVNAPTNMHTELMVAAANAGKHIFTEKVMALTVEECERISAAVREADVKFLISYPYRSRPDVQYAKQVVDEGLLGDLTFMRVRVAHNAGSAGWLPEHFWDPVQTGGGAMMDLGAHPMYLLRWLGGQPKKITSSFTYLLEREVEDNAVSVIEFENGLIGVSDTSFVSTHSPFALELSGTEGTLLVGGPEGRLQIRSNKLEDTNWHTPAEMPQQLPPPLRIWVEAVLHGGEIPFGLEEGTQLTELMQYAYESHRNGCQVEIPQRG